ncbi:SDR family oxidoreductase [Devosia rhodophyticola]|uniref:UDP-glucose 4-epimerase n=1 Tax=Devosia rhodophyticola TaxID=3026423 RepID=A0ABY7Z0P6_9HYPH|nr:SDR family oxidoreductase [Devosia rhodophyticola]WDR07102.1 SDR family oxidoreductase [Devosia rhodophyticola]
MAKRVLFIGGTGQISYPCVERAVSQGYDVSVFNRGRSGAALPTGTTSIVGDMNGPEYDGLADLGFDVVCQFIAFTPDQLARDIALFSGKVGQYIFISSASVYEKPASHYVITEQTPAINPFWTYSQNKIACEKLLKDSSNLPWTIIRPSHTVRTGLPTMMGEGDLIARRMLEGEPVVVAGDGNTPWTLTRSIDFAVPFVSLFGKSGAIKETFHITSDTAHTWDAIYSSIGKALGVEPRVVHVPTDTLVRYRSDWEGPLTGDKSWSALFDNTKVKGVAGAFACETRLDEILAESMKFLKQRLERGMPEKGEMDALLDRICTDQSALGR